MVAAHGQCFSAGLNKPIKVSLDDGDGFLEIKGVERHITYISDLKTVKGCGTRVHPVGTNQHTLRANPARTKACTWAITGAYIKWHTNYGDIEIVGIGLFR